MNASDMIHKAKVHLVMEHPFFASLALNLRPEESDKVDTLATDGSIMLYKPTYIEGLSIEQIKGCLAHLVLHCALGHVWRGEALEDEPRWQKAADYATNEELLKAGFDLPQGYLHDKSYDKLNAEQIYTKLPPSKQQQNNQQGKNKQPPPKGERQDITDPGKCGAVMPSSTSVKEQKAKWKTETAKALMFATQEKGELPDTLERMIRDAVFPKLPWTTLLRDFVQRSARNDYNWTRVNVKHLLRGFVLPTLHSDELPRVLIAVDTSMSISDEQLNRFGTEISGILAAYNTTTEVVYCDAKVHSTEIFASEDLPIKLHPVGGGGTDFRPVFDYAAKMQESFACILFFTDLKGTFPENEPPWPVSWISTCEGKAPFGDTILFE